MESDDEFTAMWISVYSFLLSFVQRRIYHLNHSFEFWMGGYENEYIWITYALLRKNQELKLFNLKLYLLIYIFPGTLPHSRKDLTVLSLSPFCPSSIYDYSKLNVTLINTVNVSKTKILLFLLIICKIKDPQMIFFAHMLTYLVPRE